MLEHPSVRVQVRALARPGPWERETHARFLFLQSDHADVLVVALVELAAGEGREPVEAEGLDVETGDHRPVREGLTERVERGCAFGRRDVAHHAAREAVARAR